MNLVITKRLFACGFISAMLAMVPGTGGLFALDVYTKVELQGDISLSLPMSWKVLWKAAPGMGQSHLAGSQNKPDSTLLLTARPADSAKNVSISLFRINLQTSGSAAAADEPWRQTALQDLLNVVLSEGFSPTDEESTESVSANHSTNTITAKVFAQNATGDVWAFTSTEVALPSATIRLFSVRPASDRAALEELNSVINSFNVQGAVSQHGKPGAAGSKPKPNYFGSPVPPEESEPPSQPASPPETVAAPSGITNRAAQLTQQNHNTLLIVEGQKGVGSGFLCAIGGTAYAITNAHVLSDNTGIKLKALNGSQLTPGPAGIAVGHDILRIAIQNGAQPLEIMTGIDENVKIGDPVLIPGNAEGAGVVRAIEGKVVGIGPNLIEVDAPFVKGNSGSPIIHQPSGKVLGVATYYTERKVDQANGGGVKTEIRRFGYRLDSVTEWEPVNWQQFYLQSGQIAKIWELSEDYIHLFNSSHANKELNAADYSSPAVRHAIQDFLNVVNKGAHTRNSYSTERTGTASLADRQEALRRLLATLRSISRSDISTFDMRSAYDYFRRQASDEIQLREQVQEIFTKAIESHL